jgi:hypothetical protein
MRYLVLFLLTQKSQKYYYGGKKNSVYLPKTAGKGYLPPAFQRKSKKPLHFFFPL